MNNQFKVIFRVTLFFLAIGVSDLVSARSQDVQTTQAAKAAVPKKLATSVAQSPVDAKPTSSHLRPWFAALEVAYRTDPNSRSSKESNPAQWGFQISRKFEKIIPSFHFAYSSQREVSGSASVQDSQVSFMTTVAYQITLVDQYFFFEPFYSFGLFQQTVTTELAQVSGTDKSLWEPFHEIGIGGSYVWENGIQLGLQVAGQYSRRMSPEWAPLGRLALGYLF